MQVAKIFMNGRSQAVRLPKECRLEGTEVYVKKIDGIVMLIPKADPLAAFVRSLDMFSEDFMEERNQPPQQIREAL